MIHNRSVIAGGLSEEAACDKARGYEACKEVDFLGGGKGLGVRFEEVGNVRVLLSKLG